MGDEATSGDRAGTTRLLLAMGLASGITSVPNAAFVLALPAIHRELGASLTEASQEPALARPNMTEPFSGLAPRP